MKKISRTVLSIFMCAIFSALTFFTASAVLPYEMRVQADTFFQQHCEFAPDRHPSIEGLRRWKLRVSGYIKIIGGTSKDKVFIPEFLLYLAYKLTGNKGLEDAKVYQYRVNYFSDEGKTGAIVFDFVNTSGQVSRIII